MNSSGDPIYWSKVFAWIATASCVVVSVRSASVFSRHNPRIYSILALLSLIWAILIPYYNQAQLPELLVGFTGFLFAYIGVLLRREAYDPTAPQIQPFWVVGSEMTQQRSIKRDSDNANDGQAVALFFLPALVLPSAIPVISSFFPVPIDIISFDSRILQPVIPTILLLVGYFQIGKGINTYSTHVLGKLLMTVLLFVYSFTDSIYTIFAVYCNLHATSNINQKTFSNFFKVPPGPPMTAKYLVAFGILKLLFCALFIPLVLNQSLSAEDRALSWRNKIKKWLGITVFPPKATQKLTATWAGIAGEFQSDGRLDLCHDKVELARNNSRISGELYTTELRVRSWVVEGAYEKDILVLWYKPTEGTNRGIGALVLEHDEKTGIFKGCWLGYDRHKKQIGAGPYILSTDTDIDAVEKANLEWLSTPCYFPGSTPPGASAAGAEDLNP